MTQETFNCAQCEGCGYYRRISSMGVMYCCHYLLDTGKPRKRDGVKCLSYDPEPQKRRTLIDIKF